MPNAIINFGAIDTHAAITNATNAVLTMSDNNTVRNELRHHQFDADDDDDDDANDRWVNSMGDQSGRSRDTARLTLDDDIGEDGDPTMMSDIADAGNDDARRSRERRADGPPATTPRDVVTGMTTTSDVDDGRREEQRSNSATIATG